MFSPNKNNLIGTAYDPQYIQNSRQFKEMQAKILSEEYQKSLNIKMQKKQQEKQRKKQQLELYNQSHENYLDKLAANKLNRLQERKYIAQQYDSMIDYRRKKEENQKRSQKYLQNDMLNKRTWLRDKDEEREISKYKTNRYNQELDMLIKAKQQKLKREQQIERQRKQTIDWQAQQILNKQIHQLQQRKKKLYLFEQRQNQLLGNARTIQNQMGRPSSLNKSSVLDERALRKKQQQLYSRGLEIQFQNEIEKRRKNPQQGYTPGEMYNPITNPIPVPYKNPNVLKMVYQI